MAKKWIFYGKSKFEGHFQNLEQKVIDQIFLKNWFSISKLCIHAKNPIDTSKTECFIDKFRVWPTLMAPTLCYFDGNSQI